MKKLGHLNRDIAGVLAGMGHTDFIVIADCGLPIPPGVECIDLSLKLGVPSFADVLDSVLADFQVERAVFASEAQALNPQVMARFAAADQAHVQIAQVPHDDFKALTRRAHAIIRTGEATPYANVILHSGVIF